MHKRFFGISVISLSVFFTAFVLMSPHVYSWPWDAKPKAKPKKEEVRIPPAPQQPEATEPKFEPSNVTVRKEGNYTIRSSSVPFGDAEAWKSEAQSEESKLSETEKSEKEKGNEPEKKKEEMPTPIPPVYTPIPKPIQTAYTPVPKAVTVKPFVLPSKPTPPATKIYQPLKLQPTSGATESVGAEGTPPTPKVEKKLEKGKKSKSEKKRKK